MQDAIGIATKLMNKKIGTLVECHTKNQKRLGVLQMPILLTSKKALEQVRRLDATNVEIKGTTGEIVRSKRTKTMKTKSKLLRHVE
uniref:Uncharacterized protein n=1 Tax=Tanacetum cinerariifolium TaxID=118510 RepID=A0A699T2I6_TANCI|nr:hypothetical protein [Tanacetum cinerariifolium]